MATSGLVACSNNWGDVSTPESTAAKADTGTASAPVTIEYWHRLPDKQGTMTVEQATEEFNKSHPNIQVKTVKFEGGANESYDKISAALKAGNAPCLAQASYDGIPGMLVRGELLDVSEQAAQYKKNYEEGPWGQVALAGKVYGLPQDTGPLVYYYDQDAFDKLGLKPPTTWDEYFDNAKKAHAAGKYTSAFFPDDAGDFLGAVNAANRANWFAIDGASWRVDMESEKSKEVARKWQKSIDEGATMVADRWGDHSPTDAALKDGKLIGYVGAAWEAAWNLDPLGVEKANWHVAQMPDKHSGPWGGSALVVLKSCGYPEAALEYANWYNTNLKAMVSQGLVPAAKGAVETPQKVKDLYGGQDVMAALTEAAAISDPDWVYIPTWPAVKKTIQDNAGKSMPLEENLKSAQEVAKSSLEGQGLAVAKF